MLFSPEIEPGYFLSGARYPNRRTESVLWLEYRALDRRYPGSLFDSGINSQYELHFYSYSNSTWLSQSSEHINFENSPTHAHIVRNYLPRALPGI